MIGTIVTALLLWALISALTAPFESMGWWAGWFGETEDGDTDDVSLREAAADAGETTENSKKYFLVFLTGVGGFENEVRLPDEVKFLEKLSRRLPEAQIVDDIFPYSPTNRALTGDRFFSWFWRRAEKSLLTAKLPITGLMINVRNIFQVAVAADHRYGPMYGRASARLVVDGLRRSGYPFGHNVPVYLIGWSGGGQIAFSAARYLVEELDMPVSVLSIGGVFCSDPGIEATERIVHMRGTKDVLEKTGRVVFPGRWPIAKNSVWNQAIEQGKVTIITMGPWGHVRQHSYMDDVNHVNEEQTYTDKTVETIAQQLEAA